MIDGIFDLKSAEHLCKKLEFDYDRLMRTPHNAYVAFDFFMTAAHIPDWIANGDTGASRTFRRNKPILRVCYQLACHGKHFHLTSKDHDSVAKSEKSRYVEADYVEEDYFKEPLLITLTGNLAETLGLSNPVGALELANIAVSFWRSWLISQRG